VDLVAIARQEMIARGFEPDVPVAAQQQAEGAQQKAETGLPGAPQRRKSPVGEGPTQGGCWLNLVACERPSRETG
jgi:hypothetical protein